jgi:RNase P/RNase MRP subunit p29
MNTFLVETASGREVLIPKAGQGFAFRVGDARIDIRGNDIRFRPEDRTKKLR